MIELLLTEPFRQEDTGRLSDIEGFTVSWSKEPSDKELKKAEQMSYRTIVAEPRNGTYLDTYAWILYQQERYEEARIYIDQTLRADSLSHSEQGDSAIHSATILEHAGDIYMKVGNRKRALELYEEALKLEPENAEDIRKRMKAK